MSWWIKDNLCLKGDAIDWGTGCNGSKRAIRIIRLSKNRVRKPSSNSTILRKPIKHKLTIDAVILLGSLRNFPGLFVNDLGFVSQTALSSQDPGAVTRTFEWHPQCQRGCGGSQLFYSTYLWHSWNKKMWNTFSKTWHHRHRISAQLFQLSFSF